LDARRASVISRADGMLVAHERRCVERRQVFYRRMNAGVVTQPG
jgi:hypothetical protein